MEGYQYQELKGDIASLITETISLGNSVEGSFGRAFYEYWLEDEVLERTYPTTRPMKLMAIVATLDHMRERGINHHTEDLPSVLWLSDNLSKEELSSMYSQTDIAKMLVDAEKSLPKAIANQLVLKFGAS